MTSDSVVARPSSSDADAVEQVAVGDAGRGEEGVVAADQVVGLEHPGEVVARLLCGLALGVVGRPEAPEDAPAEALDRGGRDHSFGGSAHAPEQVDPGVRHHCEQGRGYVAIRDEADAGADLAECVDGLVVARAVEHDHGHVAGLPALALGDLPDHVLERVGEADQVRGARAGRDLLHVEAGSRVEHGALVGECDHRERRRHSAGRQCRALEWVDGDVDGRRAAVADALAVVEHRGLVLLALADHDDAVHRNGVEHQAHGVHSGAVGALLLAAADPAARRQGPGFGHAHELEREVAVGLGARARVLGDHGVVGGVGHRDQAR